MTLTEQLQAERRERQHATNEAQRIEVDPNRFRSDADRARLAATDAARIAAEAELNSTLRAANAAREAVDALAGRDWESLAWPDGATGPAAAAVNRSKAANLAVDEAREKLQTTIRAHNAAVGEIDAAARARRRQSKIDAGQMA